MTFETQQPEPRFKNSRSILLGAFYGFLIGNAFVIAASVVDRILYPELPLGFDVSLFVMRWGWIGLGLALVGAIASLFNERLPSLLFGALFAGLLALVSALYVSPVSNGMKVIIVIFALAPMAVMALPVPWLLRRLEDRHEESREAGKGLAHVLPLVLLAVVLGLGGGYFLKMSGRAVQATRFAHELIQSAHQDADSPLRKLPGFPEHLKEEYRLFQHRSETSTEGFDVRAEYSDGYNVDCVVVVYPGQNPYLSGCTSSQN